VVRNKVKKEQVFYFILIFLISTFVLLNLDAIPKCFFVGGVPKLWGALSFVGAFPVYQG
jgi:hypothetical protein